jgi:hypothetical protein
MGGYILNGYPQHQPFISERGTAPSQLNTSRMQYVMFFSRDEVISVLVVTQIFLLCSPILSSLPLQGSPNPIVLDFVTGRRCDVENEGNDRYQ